MDRLSVNSLLSFTLIDRYLIQELYKTFLGVTVVLVMIIFANNFVLSLEKIVLGQFSSDALVQLMSFELLEMVNFIIPPAFFFAILISLGRLYRDSEIIAMQASGVGPGTFYKSYLLGAIPVIIVTLLMVLYTLPWAQYSMAQLEANQDRDNTTFAAIEVGKFQEIQGGETVFFAASEGDEPGELRDVFIQNRRNGRLGIISAKEAYQLIDKETAQHFLVLKNGYRYTGEPGQNTYTTSSFYEYGIRIRQLEQKQAKVPVKALPTAELWRSGNPLHRMEMQFRYSIPLAVLALTFLAIPLSRSMPRQGIYGRMLVAFVVYFTFMNLHKVAEKWMEDGDSPLWLGMWWVPFVAVGVALMIETRDRYAYLLTSRAFIKRFKKA
ncbi:MAG: LPS export ABC transporter permease LptF [Gammaproteobacteria bacterium]|nr:LPS export ABC transporter permease LptF [Gammaproteobacteria bacterium]